MNENTIAKNILLSNRAKRILSVYIVMHLFQFKNPLKM